MIKLLWNGLQIIWVTAPGIIQSYLQFIIFKGYPWLQERLLQISEPPYAIRIFVLYNFAWLNNIIVFLYILLQD